MVDKKNPQNLHGDNDLDALIEQKLKLEAVIQEKFMKVMTVMFTDLKGSTAIAESQGDIGTRMLLKHHNDIVLPSIKESNGTFVKSIGDGTLSYFPTAQDALRAAVRIQRELAAFNASKTVPIPILMRIGLHTGKVLAEKGDISGDVVNTASRFESVAGVGEIYLSEATHDALADRNETACRYIKTITLKGKLEPVKVYKAYWNPDEPHVEVPEDQTAAEPGVPTKVKIAVALVILAVILFILLRVMGTPKDDGETEQEKRTIRKTVEEPVKK